MQQLAIHTVGGVVTPAQSLLVIVPSDSRLEIEAMVSNRDIGFVRAGQEAEVKIDTFNFTRTASCMARCSAFRRTPSSATADKTAPTIAGSGRDQLQRASRSGAELHRAYFARPCADADRRADGQSVARHGDDGGNQDRITHNPELSLVASAALPARNIARAVKRPARTPALRKQVFQALEYLIC